MVNSSSVRQIVLHIEKDHTFIQTKTACMAIVGMARSYLI